MLNMTWNEQNHAASIADVLEGTVEEWYDQVDGLLKASDFIPGNYEYAVNVSYANSGEFHEGGQTHVDISCDRFKIISLDNSYLQLEMNIPVTIPQIAAKGSHTAHRFKHYYIGFKSAFDVIDQYRIYSNSDLIQTQNHANYESYLQYMALSDSAKENSELYATWDKIQSMNEDVPGVYVDVSGVQTNASPKLNIPLKLRIPLNQFLMFANLKWFPGFFGKLTLEIYPSYKNLVICPILDMLPEQVIIPTKVSNITISGSNATATQAVVDEAANVIKKSSFEAMIKESAELGSNLVGFRQINTPVLAGFYDKTADHSKVEAMGTFTCSESTTKKCHLRLAEAIVRMDIYNKVMSRFINQPMLFPIQSIISTDFANKLPNTTEPFTCVTTNALNHCNSMFVVFKKSNNDRTCFENPMIKWQINIDGKYFPREEYESHNDPRNMNLFLDATNFNGASLFSVPNDIYHSLQPYITTIKCTDGGGTIAPTRTYSPKYRSNFAIAIPFCEDDTFQAGMHSGGTVQVELRGSRENAFLNMYNSTAPTALYVEDCILKLRAVKPSGEAQISFTHATPEQLLSSAVIAN